MNRLQRIANNESDFRDLNELRRQSVDSILVEAGFAEFICECAQTECRTPMLMTSEEYDKVRGAGSRFAVVNTSHVLPDTESIVEEFDRYVVVEKDGAGEAAAQSRDPRHHVKSCRVVVVDDVVEVRLLLKMLLQMEPNCTVVAEAGNGREAIEAVRETHPDVVVLDLEMPEMSGLEALPLIVKEAPRAKVIVFTSSIPDLNERELVNLGAFNLVPKGGAPNVIVTAIKEASLSGAAHAKRISTEDAGSTP